MPYTASPEIKTIVVATDLSQTSAAALHYARLLASVYGARVILAHVIDPVSYANLSDVPRQVLEEMTDAAREEMDRLADEFLSAGIPSNSEVRQGVVTHLLLQVIEQYKADLVILGTRGAKGIGPVVVGTVAEQLVRLAPCPVMAVAADVVSTSEAELTGGEILVPIESDAAAGKAISVAQSLAKHIHGGIILVHARTQAEALAKTDPCAATAASVNAAQGTAGVPVRCLVKDGTPADVIASVAAEYRVSMIVVPVKRESRSKSAHGTAYEVITRARTPVFFIPPAVAVAADPAPPEGMVVRC
ncbi:MAG TPA: universal stress protein [Acidisarcina sp.]|nr:universal stress protein [Acidisarcina sp.]